MDVSDVARPSWAIVIAACLHHWIGALVMADPLDMRSTCEPVLSLMEWNGFERQRHRYRLEWADLHPQLSTHPRGFEPLTFGSVGQYGASISGRHPGSQLVSELRLPTIELAGSRRVRLPQFTGNRTDFNGFSDITRTYRVSRGPILIIGRGLSLWTEFWSKSCLRFSRRAHTLEDIANQGLVCPGSSGT